MIEINGMAHVILTVARFDVALAFYGRLMPFLGLQPVFKGENFAYWVGGRTAVGIERCGAGREGERFAQGRVGLHHVCFRARTREDVDKCAAHLREIGAAIVRGPLEAAGRPATTTSSSRTPTASASSSTTSPAPASSAPAPRSTRRGAIREGAARWRGCSPSGRSPGLFERIPKR
jgi:catechol 2,3-dioxygenase-like lactoylglutathione lyase family enzyme